MDNNTRIPELEEITFPSTAENTTMFPSIELGPINIQFKQFHIDYFPGEQFVPTFKHPTSKLIVEKHTYILDKS